MPKATLTTAGASDAAIAADAGRIYVEFSASADCRFSIGATYVEADSQRLLANEIRIFEGTLAEQAFSFSDGKDTIISISTL